MDSISGSLVRLICKSVVLSLVLILLVGCATFVQPPKYSGALPKYQVGSTIALIGDLQRTSFLESWRERNNTQREALLRQLAASHPDVIVTLGDHVFWGSSTDDWEYFDKVMTPIRKKSIPIIPVLGNHEYMGVDEDMYRQISERFPLYDSSWYSIVVDSIAFVILNTNYRDIGMSVMDKQRRWFVKEMRRFDADSSVLFTIVCGHHPPFTNSLVVDDEDLLQSYFVPSYTHSLKGAFWFCGHSHAYERFLIDGKQFVVSGGGGGPRQRLATGIWSQHEDSYQGEMIRPFHYCTLKRNGGELNFAMVPLRTDVFTPGDTVQLTTRESRR